ncbi:MAG: Omp28-related outer membrane protein [Alistipes sp.]|nr:Omp28-related outer membrane protein [Alistipes sp.]
MKWYSKFLSCATACAALLATVALPACSESDEPGPATKGLTLTAAPTTFVAGEGSTSFKVTFDGQDVTSAAEISTSGTKVENASWTTSTAGTYKFTATYEGNTSNEVTVTVTEKNETPTTKYYRYVLLNKFTQVTCTYCAVAENNLRSLTPEEQEQFLTIAVHCGDRLTSLEGGSLGASLGISTYPTWVFNMKKTELYTGSDVLGASALRSKLLLANSRNPALCGIKAESTVEGATAKVKATVDFQKAANFRIVCVLTENGLPRTNGSETLEIFDNVLRAVASDSDGNKLNLFTNGKLVEVAETGEQEFEFSIELKEEWKKENCDVVIYVLHEQAVDKSYLMNNGVVCPLGESVDYRYAE